MCIYYLSILVLIIGGVFMFFSNAFFSLEKIIGGMNLPLFVYMFITVLFIDSFK